jgi:integrase/recombinase XerD
VVWSKNRLLKPHWVLIGGQEQEHPEGYYSLEWRENGRRVRQGVGNDPVSAMNALRKKEALIKARALGIVVQEPDGQGGVLLVDAINSYLQEIKEQRKKKTHVAYKTALEYFKQSCHKQYLRDVDRKDILHYATFLRDEKELEPRTVNVKFGYLMTFLKAQNMPRLARKEDWPRYTETEPEIYDKNELDAFFKACSAEERMYFQFFLKTGMREQEVMHCTWSNIDLDAGTVSVRANKRFGFQPKTYEERTIPIPDDLVEQLREWKKGSKSECPLVFPTSGCRPKGDFLDICKGIALHAKVNCGHCDTTLNRQPATCRTSPVCEHWFLHKFRATFCTWHLWSGQDLRTVQSYMGHRDMASTMRYLRPRRDAEARQKVNAAFR